MTFKPSIWQPIAIVLSVLNVAAVAYASSQGEPSHAAGHAALALVFGVWAQRLGHRRGKGEPQPPLEALAELEAEVSQLRAELTETQERLDFAERMLAQGQETRRVGPERQN
jgi:hypothetical protein